jgi:hypothetical protein
MDPKEALQKVQDYVCLLESEVPPILQNWEEHFPFSPSSEKGLCLLLIYASLQQGISERALASWMWQWHEVLGDSLLQAHTISYNSLHATCSSVTGFSNWELSEKAVGIIRSVGDFTQHKRQTHRGLNIWTKQSYHMETAVEELANTVFYMGKSSLTKPKPRTFFWLYMCTVMNLGEDVLKKEVSLPVTAGGRSLMKFIQKKSPTLFASWALHKWEIGSVEELDAYNRMLRDLSPREPWKAQYPVSLYRRRGLESLHKYKELTKEWNLFGIKSMGDKRNS